MQHRDEVIAAYLRTPRGKARLRRAMGFDGDWVGRWSRRLWVLSRKLRLGLRVIRGKA